jgi:anthranilate phosphoribosyltransferase
MISAIVLINVEKGSVPEVARQLGEIPEVTEIYSVAGPYDVVAKVQVEEYERMSEVITEKLQAVEGITSTETLMTFRMYKF